MPCSNAAKTRNPLKFAGVPQIRQQISAVGRPKFTILRGHVEDISLLNDFFPIVDTCLNCEHIARRQSCGLVRRWRFWRNFCVLYFQRARCSTFQPCIINLHYGHTMWRSMVDIQSTATDIRRWRNERKKKEETTGQKYNGLPYYIGRP